jgi:hypothetical protein
VLLNTVKEMQEDSKISLALEVQTVIRLSTLSITKPTVLLLL